jgi:hypothetical protein
VERLPDLQSAVRALPGVASATVRWPDPHGPARLEVTFAAEADQERTAAAVLAAMADIAGVDPRDLDARPTSDAAPVPPAPLAARAARPVFSGLVVERTDLDSSVTVTLDQDGRTAQAQADGLATQRSTPRTAAAAALMALRELLPDGVRVQLEWLEVVESPAPGRPDLVHAAVTCLTAAGEETHLGTALVRGDVREAAVRATLDALNRRLDRLAPAVSA